jgi:hypothetical protein
MYPGHETRGEAAMATADRDGRVPSMVRSETTIRRALSKAPSRSTLAAASRCLHHQLASEWLQNTAQWVWRQRGQLHIAWRAYNKCVVLSSQAFCCAHRPILVSHLPSPIPLLPSVPHPQLAAGAVPGPPPVPERQAGHQRRPGGRD